jgi:hypothetical protein
MDGRSKIRALGKRGFFGNGAFSSRSPEWQFGSA